MDHQRSTVDGGTGSWHPHDGEDAGALVLDDLLPAVRRDHRLAGLVTERLGLVGWSVSGLGRSGVPWTTTADIEVFTAAAGEFLSSRPVEHSPLLTEADHVGWHPEPEADQAYGWWTDDAGDVTGAFLRAPRHPTFLTPIPDAGVDDLVALLPLDLGVGCDVTTVDAVLAAGKRAGIRLGPRHRIVIHRLGEAHPAAPTSGTARLAAPSDRALIDDWFDALMAAHPGDASDRTYVVGDPLAEQRIVLWEVAGSPIAMAGWSRTVSAMTRVSAVYAPSGDPRVETAVLAAATAAGARVASEVLMLVARDDQTAASRLAALGYRAVRERVMLAPTT